MSSTPTLYDYTPALSLLGVALTLTALVLWAWWWRVRPGSAAKRLRALTLLTLMLTFDLVVFGAFTRLTDSGLGCPDWPGCFGHASPLGAAAHIELAEAAMPTGPVTQGKAWIEMIHRYLAMTVGALIIVLLALHVQLARQRRVAQKTDSGPSDEALSYARPWLAGLTLFWVCLQGAFGAWTVTFKLQPLIVTLHLLGGMGLLSLLAWQAAEHARLSQSTRAEVPSLTQGAAVIPATPALVVWPQGLRGLLLAVLALLWLQLALGAWVSTNYAALACTGFPSCNGQWWPAMSSEGFALWRPLGREADGDFLPFSALVAIHFSHRLLAYVVLLGLVVLYLGLRRRVQGVWVQALAGLAVLQLLTGLSNVVFQWPLWAALLHTAGAAGLVLCLTWGLQQSLCSERGVRS